jgi:predicted MFS family arabinose efflux permease
MHFGFVKTGAGAKQLAILIGCAITACALVPLTRLHPPPPPREPRIYPSSPFLFRFLLAFGVWHLAIGIFNPFFNTYFSRVIGASVEQIGVIFAGSQFAQAAAVLLAPPILKKFGMIHGISGMQIAAGMLLVALAPGPPAIIAACVYGGFMSFQVMSEPGMFSLLMSRVRAAEHSGASGMAFFTLFCAHAVAAAFAGWVITHAGYRAVLITSACVTLVAALLFNLLLRRPAEAALEEVEKVGVAGSEP